LRAYLTSDADHNGLVLAVRLQESIEVAGDLHVCEVVGKTVHLNFDLAKMGTGENDRRADLKARYAQRQFPWLDECVLSIQYHYQQHFVTVALREIITMAVHIAVGGATQNRKTAQSVPWLTFHELSASRERCTVESHKP
jgi:hypothetical protein